MGSNQLFDIDSDGLSIEGGVAFIPMISSLLLSQLPSSNASQESQRNPFSAENIFILKRKV